MCTVPPCMTNLPVQSCRDAEFIKLPRVLQGHRLPLTPELALKEMGSLLTEYEKTEVLEYPEVWFMGHESKKITGEVGKPQNAGTYVPQYCTSVLYVSAVCVCALEDVCCGSNITVLTELL